MTPIQKHVLYYKHIAIYPLAVLMGLVMDLTLDQAMLASSILVAMAMVTVSANPPAPLGVMFSTVIASYYLYSWFPEHGKEYFPLEFYETAMQSHPFSACVISIANIIYLVMLTKRYGLRTDRKKDNILR